MAHNRVNDFALSQIFCNFPDNRVEHSTNQVDFNTIESILITIELILETHTKQTACHMVHSRCRVTVHQPRNVCG